MTPKKFEVGDVVATAGTTNLMIVVELMDEQLAWVCAASDCKAVDLIEIQELRFISKGGHSRCRRLQPKAHRFPMG
jgi:hypothetical protein